ncbi:hypothetical protein [Sanguibacter suaedae]|uniref:Uncharacterized protein n=1 Tax=Sanguibacter suaedae TaxID=2795737 RepID=A0A934IAS5_9MICO|nr:hypothetical protein [Sanguibacter suaedae]MBI9115027.1 hypothetical protein [Sanguibacter suaedae]
MDNSLRFTHTTDVGLGSWIREATGRAAHAPDDPFELGMFVPLGYPRIVAVPNDLDVPWPLADLDPEERREGTLAPDRLAALMGAVDSAAGPSPVTVGMWTGYGHVVAPGARRTGASMTYVRVGPIASRLPRGLLHRYLRARSRVSGDDVRDLTRQREQGWVTTFDVDVRSEPLLELPGREYALFRGTTTALRDPAWLRRSGWAWAWEDTVDLCWPDDRSWFAYADTDLTQTYLACDDDLAEAVLAAGLAASEVRSTDPPR